MQAIKKSKGWIFGFSLLAGIILLLPFASKTTHADTNTITWDSSVLSTLAEEDAEQTNKGITLNGTKVKYLDSGEVIEFTKDDNVSFSSSIGNIKSIVMTLNTLRVEHSGSLNLRDGWEFENGIFTWISNTAVDNVAFSYGRHAVMELDSIVFTIENPHEHSSSLVKTDKVEPTCTTDGHEAYWTCSECGKMFSDSEGRNEISNPITIPATGHDWNKGTVTKAATTASTGVKTFTCTRCGDTKTEVIPKLKTEAKPSGKVGVTKKGNPLKVKISSKTYKRSSLKKAKSFKIGATKAQGKVTYTLDKKAKKAKIKVSSGGKVTIPKKCKKGTYKITVKAAGNGRYKAGSKIVKIIIK